MDHDIFVRGIRDSKLNYSRHNNQNPEDDKNQIRYGQEDVKRHGQAIDERGDEAQTESGGHNDASEKKDDALIGVVTREF